MDVVSLSELSGDEREYLRMTDRFISNHYARFLFIIITVFSDSYTNDGYKPVYTTQRKSETQLSDFSSLLSANVLTDCTSFMNY
jgi:hypothetical protein